MLVITDTPTTFIPVFPDCPTWCDQYDMHPPDGEVDQRNGDLMPRDHRTVLTDLPVASWPRTGTSIARVELVRSDGGDCDGGAPEVGGLELFVSFYSGRGDGVTTVKATAEQAAGIADALTRGAALMGGAA
jgi:hypothetical protein